jgi:ketosteroid isomerase-like protein
MMSPRILAVLPAIVLSAAMAVAAQEDGIAGEAMSAARSMQHRAAPPDSIAAVAAVARFRAALERGDSATALAMLAPDAIILESGDVETRAEYRKHHLPADIEFARAIPGTHVLASVIVHGDAAWVSSTSITQGRMKDRTINSAGAELMVLSRTEARSPWQIRTIHWSSHRRRS